MSNGVQVMTPAQMANAIAGYTAGLPKPYTDQQVSAKAKALLDPVVAGITSRIGAQTKASTGALAGYANEAANRLGSYSDSAKNIYGSAESAQAAANAAEAGGLRGTGTQLADQLAGKISQITADPAAAAAAMPNTSAAANALYGIGSASLDKLIGEGTAAQDYAAKLPGLQRAQGQSDIRDVTLASQKNQADQIATAEQQLPGLVQGLRSESDSRATNIASTRNQASQYLEGRNDANTKFLQAEKDAGINATTKAAATVKAATIKANAQATASAKPNAALSKAVGYVVDANGNWIPGKNGKPQMLPGYTTDGKGNVVKTATGKTGKAGKGSTETPAQVQTYLKGLTTYKTVNTKTDTGSESTKEPAGHTVSFIDAYRRLRTPVAKGGYGLDDQTARQYLDGVYKRGDDGRAWLTNEEQAVLKQAAASRGEGGYAGLKGEQAKDITGVNLDPVSHHRFLSPVQYQILKGAGHLPPGAFQDTPLGKRWYIAQ